MKLTQNINTEIFWNYKGGLTTPNCNEQVEWVVLAEVQSLSQQQFDDLNALWAGNPKFANGFGNNRELMPLNGRTIYVKGML